MKKRVFVGKEKTVFDVLKEFLGFLEGKEMVFGWFLGSRRFQVFSCLFLLGVIEK